MPTDDFTSDNPYTPDGDDIFDDKWIYSEGPDSIDQTEQSAFLLTGSVTFGPFYAPSRTSVTKKRELNREENFCGGQDVTDLGSKNREIHVAGSLLEEELSAFNALLDNKDRLDLTTPGWTGEVMVKEGEYEGPVGKDAHTGQMLYNYSVDLVSTGRDEPDNSTGQQHVPETEPDDTRLTEGQIEALEDGEPIGL